MERMLKVTLGVLALWGWPLFGQAGVIDTTPPTIFISYFDYTGVDAAGGTFVADDVVLESFSLDIAPLLAGGTFSAVVMDTSGGAPNAVLWTSAVTAIPGVSTHFVFNPGVSLTIGAQYFIGVDTGILTAASGSFDLGFVNDTIGGVWTQNVNNGGWVGDATYDIASRIVMTAGAVPVPASLALLGLGVAGLGWSKRGRV